MRCGRILVEGEAEEIAASSPRSCKIPRRQQSRNKKDGKNPYATRGLEKFASLHEELAAKREYVAKKTGASEDLVRFCYRNKGWVPMVVKVGRSEGGDDPRVKILRPLRKKKDNGSEENDTECRRNDTESLEIENGCENHDNVSVEPVVPWSAYLMTTAFGILTLSAMVFRKSVFPAAAMAVIMVLGSLQKRWKGGVMCMKKFVVGGLSYFSDLVVQWKNKMVKKDPEKIVENPIRNRPENVIKSGEIKKRHGQSLSVCTSPLRGLTKSHPSSPKQGATKSKEYTRIVSMDGQPRKPIRSDYRKSESLNRSLNTRRVKKGGSAPNFDFGATVMIIVLICLIFYGRICAILFTSAWWYLLPKFRIEANNSEKGDFSKMDLKQKELRKKKVIMDGLLDRSHNINVGRS